MTQKVEDKKRLGFHSSAQSSLGPVGPPGKNFISYAPFPFLVRGIVKPTLTKYVCLSHLPPPPFPSLPLCPSPHLNDVTGNHPS